MSKSIKLVLIGPEYLLDWGGSKRPELFFSLSFLKSITILMRGRPCEARFF